MHFFTTQLLYWHKKYNKRVLPWKQENDPYKIWLSEIILQQTRAEQGLPYYQKFVKKYPTIVHLAKAKDDEVFKLWEGLGYYSRCKNLLITARKIAKDNQGVFPNTYKEVLLLKGVGNYTAAAICSFAYNLPHAVVDGNVYRILSRFFNIDVAIDSTQGKKLFNQFAYQYLHPKKAAAYNQAIMDFGATVCTPKNAKCTTCVLRKECIAYKEDKIYQLPVKQKKLIHQQRYLYFLVIEFDGQYLITKRTAKDIWQNLHQFFLIEKDEPQTINDTLVHSWLNANFQRSKYSIQSVSPLQKQTLSHQKINGQFIYIKFQSLPHILTADAKNYFLVPKKEFKKYAFPKFINQYLNA